MATTMFSPAGTLVGLDKYISVLAAKDTNSPMPTQRVEFVSTIGDCSPDTFPADVLRVKAAAGKAALPRDAYHLIFSQTHEEADPLDELAGHRQHEAVREIVKRACPGHQAKLVTQRDNGRYEITEDGVTWTPGKWHTHVILANVSEREVTVERTAADGSTLTRHYAAGRAIDGWLANIDGVRRVTDAVVLEKFRYDNARYVDDCRAASRGEKVTSRDYARRAEHGHSGHDAVRVELREALALSDSWEDYRDRLAARGVRVSGGKGVSYSWVDDAGVQRHARARGEEGLGPAYTRAEVEKACAHNAAALARGEVLTPPERVMVPSPVAPEARPRPVYLTDSGRPPWEEELDSYSRVVELSGGTYEQRARTVLDDALHEALDADDAVGMAAASHVALDPAGGRARVLGPSGEVDLALDAGRAQALREAGQLELGGLEVATVSPSPPARNEHTTEREGHDDLDELIDLDGIEVVHVGSAEGADLGAERGGRGDAATPPGGAGSRPTARRADEGPEGTEREGRGAGEQARSETPRRDRAIREPDRRDDRDAGLGR